MKVQIEIPAKAVNIAKLQLTMNANDEDSLCMIDKAIERCNNDVTVVDLEELDDMMALRAALALAAISQRGNEIEQEENL